MTAREMAELAGLPPRLTYTVKQTSNYTGLPERVIRTEIAAGRLPAVRPRGSERGTFIRPEDVDAWMEANAA